MREPAQDLDPHPDDLVGRGAPQVSHEAEAAGVALERGIVEPARSTATAWQPDGLWGAVDATRQCQFQQEIARPETRG